MQAPMKWVGDRHGYVDMLDQTLLPGEMRHIEIRDAETMRDAIRRLAVRGAPAIGVAAAFGVVIALQDSKATDASGFRRDFDDAKQHMAAARPTAVNLFWALDRLGRVLADADDHDPADLHETLHREALEMEAQDRRMCDAIGRHGAVLIDSGDHLLTHCNAGSLATCGAGTALSVMYAAKDQGKDIAVFVDETRPLLQGARLTSWELMRAGIPATLITDSSAAHVMRTRGVDKVVVGADRIAANGDVANKIGTYSVAVNARAHGVPFYVAAPTSTFDMATPSGDQIPIEERSGEEITTLAGVRTAPEGVETFAPAFDVTPAGFITGIITEKGLIQPVNVETVRDVVFSS